MCMHIKIIFGVMTTNRILVFNVPVPATESDEYDLREELMKSYDGITCIKRLRHRDEDKTPKEMIEIEFEAAKYAKTILEEGFIKIEYLRCGIVGLNPRKPWNETFYQSKRTFKGEQITNKILVCDVPVTIDVNVFRQQLSKVYSGIKQLTRWYFDDDCQDSTVCVQIEFIAPRYFEHILQDGYIVDRNHSYKVMALKS